MTLTPADRAIIADALRYLARATQREIEMLRRLQDERPIVDHLARQVGVLDKLAERISI